MLIEYDTFSICSAFVCAIEYGEYSGLSDEDEKALDAFLDNLPAGYKCWQYSDETEFSRDEISGLQADCVEAKLFMNQSDL